MANSKNKYRVDLYRDKQSNTPIQTINVYTKKNADKVVSRHLKKSETASSRISKSKR